MHRKIAVALVVALAAFFATPPGFSAETQEKDGSIWQWTEKELKSIERDERRIDKEDDGYWTYKRKELLIKTDISARFTAEVTQYMKIFFDVFPEVFSVPRREKMLTEFHVFVHSSREKYLSKTGAPAWSAGVHIGRLHRVGWPAMEVHGYIAAKGEEEPTLVKNLNRAVMQHEGTHAVFQRYASYARIPTFFNEGCASYFETWNLRVEKPTKQERLERFKRSGHLRALVKKIQDNPEYRPNLAECLAMTHGQWGVGEISLHYALAESFVDFLLSTKKGRRIFRDMVEASYYRVSRRIETKLILDEDKIEDLEPEWHDHILKLVETLTRPAEQVQAQGAPIPETTTEAPQGVRLSDVGPEAFQELLGKKVNLHLDEMLFKDAVNLLTSISGVQFAIADAVDDTQTVTLKAIDKPLKDVVPMLMKATRTKCEMVEGVLTFHN